MLVKKTQNKITKHTWHVCTITFTHKGKGNVVAF